MPIGHRRSVLPARPSDPARTVASADAAIEWIDAEDGVLAFRRGRDVIVVANVTDAPAALPDVVAGDTPVISSADATPGTIAANATAWFVKRNR